VYLHLGRIESELGNHKVAERNYRYAKQLLRNCDENPSVKTKLAGVHLQLGILGIDIGNPSNAHSNFQEALRIFNDLDNFDGQAKALHGLGQANHRLKNYQDARYCYEKSIEVRRNWHEQARTYLQFASLEKELGDFDAAKQKAKKGLEIFLLCKDYSGEALTYGFFAQISIEEKDYESVEFYALKAISVAAIYPCNSNVLESIFAFLEDPQLRKQKFPEKFFGIVQGPDSNINVFQGSDGRLHVAWGIPKENLIPIGAKLLTSPPPYGL
jgi:tetratricopeptide (TPR) repeat protein